MAVTLQAILEDLNYLLGDTSVPTTGIDNQKRFINRINEDIYDHHNWRWATLSTSYSMSGTTQTLPSDFNDLIEVREEVSGSDNDNLYDIVNETNVDISDADFAAWVSGNEVDGYTLTINQTDSPTLKVTYKVKAGTLSATTHKTKVPRSLPIARGALALMQEAEDPYRDTSQTWAKYRSELDDLVRLDVRTKPAVKFYTPSENTKKYIGEPR